MRVTIHTRPRNAITVEEWALREPYKYSLETGGMLGKQCITYVQDPSKPVDLQTVYIRLYGSKEEAKQHMEGLFAFKETP